MALIDATYVKRGSLGMAANDPLLDAQLAIWIAEAESRIVSECGQPIERTTVTGHVFNGNGAVRKTFGRFPVTSVSSLQVKSGIGSAATWTTIATTEYELVTDGGYYLHYPARFIRGIANYRVTFVHGYATDAIPDDIKGVAREMVARLYTEYMGSGGRGDFNKSSVSQSAPGGGSLNTSLKNLDPSWTRILAKYTVLNVRGQ